MEVTTTSRPAPSGGRGQPWRTMIYFFFILFVLTLAGGFIVCEMIDRRF